jgi:RNA polymerase sigma-70 factor, ECF subfamily
VPDDADRPPASDATASEDSRLLERVRAGDADAIAHLVDLHGASLRRVARMYVSNPASAEDVVQETWLGLLESLERFEGRASLRTWIFRILVNCARKRARGDRRDLPFSAAWAPGNDLEASVEPHRFRGEGHWALPPRSWAELPQERLLSAEARARVQTAIDSLPDAQREVITLRDVEGWTASEVCNVAGLSDTNQRVLLHRARSKVRRALESYLDDEQE